MSKPWPSRRTHEEEQPASAELSRLLVLGFLVAALLGLGIGLGWVGWNLLKHQFGA